MLLSVGLFFKTMEKLGNFKWEDKVFIFIDKKKIKIMGEIKIDFYDKGTPAEGFH